MRAGWSRVTSLSNLLLIPPFPFSCAQDSASPPESKPTRRWGWWWSSKWWWGDRPSVVMVVAVWCCDGDQISSLSCLLVPDLFRSPLPCLLFPDPDPDLG
ncbi:hypothetical protein F2Q70_00014813 [Brassica cretica]|uniref:Secreted protein n=1 Tax=Brassica cretica TaxID=69181 RepID=A0A8S9I0V2_BRACR|nr:hypothetical protein F2Q70_00014813 [Brassica cretica]